ncbi:uncharacterized protein [Amphiura filiformis]|uniref:uncharacterized protein n=1 Tax=Amphiura filiformis TaxID=82378 RepID=UPI003B223140
MMNREDEVEDLGYEDEDHDMSTTVQPDTDPPPAVDEGAEDAPPQDEDAATGVEDDVNGLRDENDAEGSIPKEGEEAQEEAGATEGIDGDEVGAPAGGNDREDAPPTRIEVEENHEAAEEMGVSEGNDGEAEGASGGNDGEESSPTRIEITDGETGGGVRTEVTQPVGSTDNPPVSTDHSDGEDSPPPYGEPPSYDEAMQMQKGKSRPTSYVEATSGEDLEWDQDEGVEPTRLQARDGQDTQDRSTDIELEDVVVVPGYVRGSVADTTFSTPAHVPGSLDISSSQPSADEPGSSSWLPEIKFSEVSGRTWTIYGVSFLVAIVALLMLILLPLSFSYIEYYQYGMSKGRISEVVEYAKEIYDMGRYAIGPGKTFKRYPAHAHFVDYDRIGFFTTDRIILEARASFQYFIKQDELGLIEQKFDRSYEEIVKSVAEAALKNQGATYTTEEYFSQRGKVEQGLHDAIRLKLGGDCCPSRDECIRLSLCHLCSRNQSSCNKGFHVDVRFFQLKQLFIPSELTEKQLNVQLILEGNEEAVHRQSYQVIVKETEAITEKINNNAAEITNNGTTQARLILKKGTATANAIRESANSEGLKLLYDSLDMNNDEHKASLHWLRTIERHERLITGISFKDYIALMQGGGDDD